MATSQGQYKPASVCELATESCLGELASAGESLPLRRLPVTPTEHVLHSLARVVEQRDQHTARHCERLAVAGVALGIAMKLDQDSLMTLYLGGFLHDIGKIGIPDSILFKPGSLTSEEWHIMRTHTERGEEICRPLLSLKAVLPIIRHHHERWDGSGYPDGLAGADIPILARVLQVVDIYDALTNPRPYKDAFSMSRALAALEEESARGWRDPEITALFVHLNKRMFSKIAGYHTGKASELASMQDSLVHLQEFLSQ